MPDKLPSSDYMHAQQLVTVDLHRRLNLYCVGRGSPTVLFESGLGDGTLSWRSVQGAIGKSTRACSYDRAGYFYSDPASRKATAQVSVDDMLALIDHAGLGERVVLVGHSRGGLNARLFAYEHTERLAGLVLVDATVTEQLTPTATYNYVEKYESYLARGQALRACEQAARHYELRSEGPDPLQCLDNFDSPTDPDERALANSIRKLETGAVFQGTLFSERQNLFYPIDKDGDTTDGLQVRKSRHSLGSLPLVVIAANWFKSPSFKGKPTREQTLFLQWNLAQMRDIANESTRGQLIWIGSQHYVQKEQPDAVIRAIEHVVSQARSD